MFGVVSTETALWVQFSTTGRSNWRRFRDIILNGAVTEFVDDLPLQASRDMMFQLDGAPPHFANDVREWLDGVFPGRWIGRAGPVAWPARSPDLTPLDFYLWGHLKAVVYEVPTTTPDDLQERIRTACAQIRNETFIRVRHSMVHRAQLCVAAEGRHIEHFVD